jgi:hypothetical protein
LQPDRLVLKLFFSQGFCTFYSGRPIEDRRSQCQHGMAKPPDTWRRVEIGPGIELHVHAARSRRTISNG